LSIIAIVLLPRQFHVTVVENNSDAEIRRARWLFPLYLVLINLFVVPIALAGLLTFPQGSVDSDMFVLALPLSAGYNLLALTAFVGCLSAATAMVIVETIALAIMVSNDIVMPLVLKRRAALVTGHADAGALLLTARRLAIVAILLLAYMYYRSAGDAQLAAIGLLSFAAIAQLAPAFFGGLVWRRGTARGAIAGMVCGILAWAYMLLLPSFAEAGIVARDLVAAGPWGIAWLRPQALFGVDLPPLVHGVAWSLTLNILAYVALSWQRAPHSIETMQADLFVPRALSPIAPSFRLWRSSVKVDELIGTVARYLGEERTRGSFDSFAATRGIRLEGQREADFQLLRFAEHLLASAIGAASSRLVLSLLLRQRTVSTRAALKLLDDANAAIHYNREILQTALDHVRQGIAVFDKERQLVCWNRQFGELLDLPDHIVRVGIGLDDILRFNARRGAFGAGPVELLVNQRIDGYESGAEAQLERFHDRNLVVEVRSNRMPGGSVVMTFTDITPSVTAAEALEQRVRERTQELEHLNTQLGEAKAAADEANISKTRFLAAASHDILQPLNAARLYAASLTERVGGGEGARLAGSIDASLEAIEDILGALLDISRLDTGAMRPDIARFRIEEMLRQLEIEYGPLAREKKIALRFMPCSLIVRSDRRLLRRLLQNLVSNAVKYTPRGRVLIGCRRRGDHMRIDVLDTGLGIPRAQMRDIFKEFHRLEEGAKVARGLGLGLSIVERIARVLDHRIAIESIPGRGSRFSVDVPLAATASETSLQPEARTDLGQLGGMDIVCIDNDIDILAGMQTLLGGWGCRVVTADDAVGAAEAVVANGLAPAGLLVDYHLNEGNGIDAIATLRQRFGRDLPSILVTADRDPLVRDTARANGIQVLYKPVKPATLRALITQWRVQRMAAAE
ncbi:MAG: PAS-domain containing protein, partial [Proteobacteria bacterium]|nr:PAS-domain containing protein [Pseudomonadota bacterium]